MTSEVLKFTNNDTARIRSQQKEIKLDLELDSCEPKEKIKEICFELIFSYVFFLLFDKESKCLIRDQQMPLGVNLKSREGNSQTGQRTNCGWNPVWLEGS